MPFGQKLGGGGGAYIISPWMKVAERTRQKKKQSLSHSRSESDLQETKSPEVAKEPDWNRNQNPSEKHQNPFLTGT